MDRLRRSVERLDAVEQFTFDLGTGRGWVVFAPDQQASAKDIWTAVERSGFTPKRVEIGATVYTGPE